MYSLFAVCISLAAVIVCSAALSALKPASRQHKLLIPYDMLPPEFK